MGPQARRLFQTYWRNLTMVARVEGYYRIAFKGERGVTRGDPLSPTIFNVVVKAVVRHWGTVVIADEEEQGKLRKEERHQADLFQHGMPPLTGGGESIGGGVREEGHRGRPHVQGASEGTGIMHEVRRVDGDRIPDE